MDSTILDSALLQTLMQRGFYHQCTDVKALDAHVSSQPIVAYIGFDCTADSLHVGSLVMIMMLRWLQHFGHTPIVLLGGGTTKVGDPSGKDTTRKILTEEDIQKNKQGICSVFEKFLRIGDRPGDAIILDNALWLDELSYVPFLRDIGKHFSVNRLLTFDSIAARLEREQPLSFLEFNYILLQSYDFVELYRRHGCTLQLGGSDQWGNIVSGIDLGRRMVSKTLYGWTAPLLTTASGSKMGKTEKGAVWLSQDKFSAYDYWQFWRNTDDRDVNLFLRLFTDLPLDTIASVTSQAGKALNEAKVLLADWQTKTCHGQEAQELAKKTAQKTFTQSGLGADLPSVTLSFDMDEEVLLTSVMVRCGFASSNSAARRLIQQGAVKIEDVSISEVSYSFKKEHFVSTQSLKLSCGKKKFAAISCV